MTRLLTMEVDVMPSAKSTRTQPEKPSPDFPLYARNSRKWAKKIRGKIYYFGSWGVPQQSLDEYLRT